MSARYPIEGVIYPIVEEAELYERCGAWNPLTAGDALRATAARLPDKCALVHGQNRVSYGEFDAASERLGAALLDLGLRPGDRAFFQMGSTIETAIAVLACAKAALVPVCSLPQHRAIEVTALAERSEPRVYFVQADFGRFDLVKFAADMAGRHGIRHLIVARGEGHEGSGCLRLDELIQSHSLEQARAKLATVAVDVADVLMFQLSGGTTNVPKIIPRFHGEFLGTARANALRSEMDADLVALYAMPLIHTAGLIGMLYPCIILGGACILMPRMEAKAFFTLVERERVTHSISIGPAASQMLDYDGIGSHDLSSLRLLVNFDGSETMEQHVHAPCMNVYGIGEGLIISPRPSSPKEIRYDTVGWPLHETDEIRLLEPGTERPVKPGETGELCFRGSSSIRGYFRLPEVNSVSFTSDGYFRTGDMLTRAPVLGQTCYRFRGRMKDNINRGGEKFGAEEVEGIIIRHPAVIDAKVVAMPDRVYGERACAFLVMVPGAQALTVEELGEFLINEGLAKFKLPERIEKIDSFPVTRVGKVDKQALRDRIADLLATEQGTARAAPPAH